jgi:hypothetical protein
LDTISRNDAANERTRRRLDDSSRSKLYTIAAKLAIPDHEDLERDELIEQLLHRVAKLNGSSGNGITIVYSITFTAR